MAAPVKGRSPESFSQNMALVTTLFVWIFAVAIFLLFPPKFSKKEEKPLYQSISLQLAPLQDGASLNSGTTNQALESNLPATTDSPVSESTASSLSATASSKITSSKTGVTTSNPSLSNLVASPPKPEATSSPTTTPKSSASVSTTRPKPVIDTKLAVEDSSTFRAPALDPSPDPGAIPTPAPRQVTDPNAIDDEAWEKLFAQGDSTTYKSSSSPQGQVKPQQEGTVFSGVAATTNPKEGAGGSSFQGVSTSSVSREQQIEAEPSSSTASSIASINQAAFGNWEDRNEGSSGTSSGNPSSSREEVWGSSSSVPSSGTNMNLVGGGSRLLLEPSQPIISISEKNQKYILGSVEVSINFIVSPEGLVLPGSIKITPESLIHPQIQGEIKAQIGKWHFQIARGSGQVHFKYNIIKK